MAARPFFSELPQNLIRYEGEYAHLITRVNPFNCHVSWSKDGIIIDNNNRFLLNNHHGLLSLHLYDLVCNDSGIYSVMATNEMGSASVLARLVVKDYASFLADQQEQIHQQEEVNVNSANIQKKQRAKCLVSCPASGICDIDGCLKSVQEANWSRHLASDHPQYRLTGNKGSQATKTFGTSTSGMNLFKEKTNTDKFNLSGSYIPLQPLNKQSGSQQPQFGSGYNSMEGGNAVLRQDVASQQLSNQLVCQGGSSFCDFVALEANKSQENLQPIKQNILNIGGQQPPSNYAIGVWSEWNERDVGVSLQNIPSVPVQQNFACPRGLGGSTNLQNNNPEEDKENQQTINEPSINFPSTSRELPDFVFNDDINLDQQIGDVGLDILEEENSNELITPFTSPAKKIKRKQ